MSERDSELFLLACEVAELECLPLDRATERAWELYIDLIDYAMDYDESVERARLGELLAQQIGVRTI